MAEQIQHLGSRVSQEVLEGLSFSCELFRDEVGTHLNQLKDVQWEIVGRGVEILAQTLGIKLTENAEINERREQVLEDIYKTTQQIKTEIGQNGENNAPNPKRSSLIQPKTTWGEGKHER